MIDLTTQQLLKDILEFVDGHVKYAETKNAAVLAFAAGTLFAIAQVYSNSPQLLDSLRWYTLFMVFCFILAIISALISFYPLTQKKYNHNRQTGKSKSNLLFFDDAQNYDCVSYVKNLYAASNINSLDKSATRLELMYAEEIVINAKIASRKFFWSKIAVCCILVGVLPPVFIPILICKISKRET
jgi:hypothetical protein